MWLNALMRVAHNRPGQDLAGPDPGRLNGRVKDPTG